MMMGWMPWREPPRAAGAPAAAGTRARRLGVLLEAAERRADLDVDLVALGLRRSSGRARRREPQEQVVGVSEALAGAGARPPSRRRRAHERRRVPGVRRARAPPSRVGVARGARRRGGGLHVHVESAQASTSSTGSFSVTCSARPPPPPLPGAAWRWASGARRPAPRTLPPAAGCTSAARGVPRRLPGAGALLCAARDGVQKAKKTGNPTRARYERGRVCVAARAGACSRAEQAAAGVSAAPVPVVHRSFHR